MNADQDIYERLADALEALPHGFARTPSGVELKLMKAAFTPEEAWLAGQLTRTPETAAEIASGWAGTSSRSPRCSRACCRGAWSRSQGRRRGAAS